MIQSKRLAQYARDGNLSELINLIETHPEIDLNGSISKSKDTLLHISLKRNRKDIVEYLLDAGVEVNAANEQGVTPLMNAVSSSPKLIPTLLAHGADPTIRGHQNRKNALDLACGNHKIELLLKSPGTFKKKQAEIGVSCCPICKARLKSKTRLDYLVEQGCQNNYVSNFLSSSACEIISSKPEYHVLTVKHHIRKEISESWAVLEALSNISSIDLDDLQLVDLCAGSSLTITTFGLLHPMSKGFAVDRMSKEFAPHLGGNLSYLQADIMDNSFLEILLDSNVVEENSVLVGMHLCGGLSIRAIQIFEKVKQFKALVLSPCCLPKRKGKTDSTEDNDYPYKHYKDETKSYEAWTDYLMELLSNHCTNVSLKKDTDILSIKNHVIVGIR